MKAHIRFIAVFNENEARYLPEKGELTPGLNIITGQSKSGKSALFDIIDWCFGNQSFVVPKGVIDSFAKIYAILIKLNHRNVLIARQGEYEGKDQMYVKDFPDNLNFQNS
jgi:DNA repair ATPase RecN